jgi:hypothetical protein
MLAMIGLGGWEIVLILLTLTLPLILAAVAVGVILAVRRRRKAIGGVSRAATPVAQQPVQPAPRKCPRCGADLKPDAPEGLCPACLLKRGIATEGGVPPGTPPFTPPSLAELAKLFPQLEIIEPIGQGGMGAVYKARQPALDRLVALKILAPRSGGDLDFSGRFTREARALARLSHPNIVAVHDFGQVSLLSPPDPLSRRSPGEGGSPLNYFLMEYVDGPNLRQVEQAGKLTPREALQIIPQICAALQFAHDEGVVHRDIKPENVLLDKKGRVKIADFGLAKILGQEADFRLTGARDVMGTPHYMAPEQVEKPQEVDHRADIYSLGVVFYEMLTGELPLGKFEPPSHRAQVDVRLDDVVLRSLEKSPARRYQHVSEVKTQVETIATSAAPLQAPAESGAAASPLPRFQIIAFTAASVLMALLLLFVGWAANRMGMFFNALFVFILLMVPVRILLILWHTFHGTIEHRLWRTPLAPELARYRWRAVNRWIFWLLAAVVLQICIVPAQFTSDQLFTIRLLTFGGVAVLMLLDLLPARRLYLATNAVYALGSIFMAVQIARIYWPESKAQAVVLSMPVRGDWLVVNGGNSSLINIHHPYKEQRNAVDMEKLVDGHERTGDAHKLESYPSWGETVYAPADGKVVVAQSNLDDNVVGEMDRDHPVGNHICIDVGDSRYVMLAHLQKESLEVAEGETVRLGQPLAKCGNSGNTSHPHLHIQVQDAPRIFVTGAQDATTYPILFRNVRRVRANQTAGGAPFFVRRNDQIICEADAVKKNEPPKITLKGIITILGKKQALLTIPGPAPGAPPEDLMLAEGQSQYEIVVDQIDENARVVKVNNHGVSQTLDLKHGDAKAATSGFVAAAETWAPALAPGEKPDPRKILASATEFMKNGEYEESLKRRIWYHNHAPEFGDTYDNVVRVVSALTEWVELGRHYPKAMQALIEIRDYDTKKLSGGGGTSDLFQEIAGINQALDKTEDTYLLYKGILTTNKKFASQCFWLAQDLLVDHGDYALCFEFMGDPQYRFEMIRNSFQMELDSQKRMADLNRINQEHMKRLNQTYFSPLDTSLTLRQSATNRFIGSVRQLVEILVGSGHKSDAEKIRDAAAAIFNDARLQSAVADAEQVIQKRKETSAAISGDDSTQIFARQPPVVVETFPLAGARNVPPGETEIRVRFSKEMMGGSWSWSTAWENSTPNSVSDAHYLADSRTCVMKVRLEPGKTYAWWLNSDKFKNFKDQAGLPAVPYLLVFQTKQN